MAHPSIALCGKSLGQQGATEGYSADLTCQADLCFRKIPKAAKWGVGWEEEWSIKTENEEGGYQVNLDEHGGYFKS